jgi:hypothetical protein
MEEVRVKERPIIFSAPMVRAILDGRKTQTRRPIADCGDLIAENHDGAIRLCRHCDHGTGYLRCPHGAPGDRLYVRETHAIMNHDTRRVWYQADCGTDGHADRGWYDATLRNNGMRWRPSIYMPRWASRITLEIVAVRVERVVEISEDDALAEGVTGDEHGADQPLPSMCFQALWDSIYTGAHAWEADPWCWCIEFKKVTA